MSGTYQVEVVPDGLRPYTLKITGPGVYPPGVAYAASHGEIERVARAWLSAYFLDNILIEVRT